MKFDEPLYKIVDHKVLGLVAYHQCSVYYLTYSLSFKLIIKLSDSFKCVCSSVMLPYEIGSNYGTSLPGTSCIPENRS